VVGSFVGVGVGKFDGIELGDGEGINEGLGDGIGVVGWSVGFWVGNGVGPQVSQAILRLYDPQELSVSGGVFVHLPTFSNIAILSEESRIIQ